MSSFGTITINGKNYVERLQIFPFEISITSNPQVLTQQRVVLPGVADFLLKGLTRATVVSGAVTARPFKFKLGNTDGAVWYMAGGLGGTTDRVLDTLCFGNGQFPYPIIPAIFYSASSSILFEIEDVSSSVPYTIYGAFHGSYLLPTS
jgi:hypothetical protein